MLKLPSVSPSCCCGCSRSGVNTMLRKVAVAAASNPHVEIRQDGEQFYIKTSTSVRTTEINFHIGEEFDEETVDGRKCKVNENSKIRYELVENGGVEWDYNSQLKEIYLFVNNFQLFNNKSCIQNTLLTIFILFSVFVLIFPVPEVI